MLTLYSIQFICYELGSGPANITAVNEFINDGLEHHIRVERFRRSSFQSVFSYANCFDNGIDKIVNATMATSPAMWTRLFRVERL